MTDRFILERDPPIDFRKILRDLDGAGYSKADIAYCLCLNRQTVGEWMPDANTVRTPRFEDARALIRLHAMVSPAFHITECVQFLGPLTACGSA